MTITIRLKSCDSSPNPYLENFFIIFFITKRDLGTKFAYWRNQNLLMLLLEKRLGILEFHFPKTDVAFYLLK